MDVGRVLWFNESKGYGFIEHDDGREVYFHYTAIAERGEDKRVANGNSVSFDLFQTNIGWEASNIRIIRAA
jgi:CspA family cold shock protein